MRTLVNGIAVGLLLLGWRFLKNISWKMSCLSGIQSLIMQWNTILAEVLRWAVKRMYLISTEENFFEISSNGWRRVVFSTAHEIRWGEWDLTRGERLALHSAENEWLICVFTHRCVVKAPLVVYLQRLLKLKDRKRAFWSNLSCCFNRMPLNLHIGLHPAASEMEN